MKIRHPRLLGAVARVAAWVIWLWTQLLRNRWVALGGVWEPDKLADGAHFIYAFWHENLLCPLYYAARMEINVLISQHADGELIARVCKHLGMGVFRGSTTRGGIEAVRQIVRENRHTHLAVTPDGPRGPRRQVQPGLIYLAARTGLPIAPVGFGFGSCWRLRTWDRFVLPTPLTRALCVSGFPIHVPADIDRDQLESYRRLVENALEELTEIAEHLANGQRIGARDQGWVSGGKLALPVLSALLETDGKPGRMKDAG
jgi:lysophospholipid acyltransferase (LPLAT)-like uncharacterized protein